MKKIIITNETRNLSDEEAMEFIYGVIKKGKISEDTKGIKHYCWASGFFDYNIIVETRKKKEDNSPESFLIKNIMNK